MTKLSKASLPMLKKMTTKQKELQSGVSKIDSDAMMKEQKDINIIDKEIICTEYAPDVFAHLRDVDGIKNFDLRKSLNPDERANSLKIL